MKKKEILQVFIDVLNEAHDLDPKAIEALMNTYTMCNEALENHESIVCSRVALGGCSREEPTLSTLGLINGICARLTGKTVVKILNEDLTYEGFEMFNNNSELVVTCEDDGWK